MPAQGYFDVLSPGVTAILLFAELPPWVRAAWIVPVGAVAALGALGVLAAAVRLLMPKIAAIAQTTLKEALAEPLFWVELVLGSLLLFALAFIPYNTFGDDVKVMKDSGLTLILLAGILLAVWTASVSVADELEGRTALTLLSKPMTRRQFLIGKFLGVLTPVYLLFVVLGVVFLVMVSFKVTFDAREAALTGDLTRFCRQEIEQVAPGLALAYLETIVFSSISVAIATRLPMVPNLIVCATIYVVGHLVPLFVQSSAGEQPIVAFVGQVLATVLPVLDHFTIQAAVAAGREVPLRYVGTAAAYSAVYSAVVMLLGLLLFEDRDLG
ncbi:MAG TPA: ABC transporter permease subunit [Pirellulales bacterium]|nr:ABC transporter permease subunit [Pirellulales bacterium]